MSHSRDRVEKLFAEALDHPASERQGFLESACGGDDALREEVSSLLRGHDGAEFLESAVVELGNRLIGTRIGRYKLLEKIGEGGSGAVYLAEQEEPIRRRVALKIIKAGMDTREVIARFEAERQTLALMEHPNIARVYDCGATDAGRPYFVMELVQGSPITQYCDDRSLTIPERLELFISVCRAIQHAHERGVVHRDIKPSNILVTLYDGIPVAKVIDFGVAKAMETRLSGKTVFTSAVQFIGTPAYMSPEQADLGTVDARSDVYSLGVLLYELLTGFTPFDGPALTSRGLEQMRRRMREEEPSRPSQRLSAADRPTQAEVAARRRTEPAKLISLLRGDLDRVVMRCIEKDSAHRYHTAVALAADIGAYLRREPMAGRPVPGESRPARWIAAAAAAAILAGFGIGLWKPWGGAGGGGAGRIEGAEQAFPHNPDLKRAMALVNGFDAIPEDFRLAEKMAREVLARHPTDPEAVTVMALIEDAFLYRSFDILQSRYAEARQYAEQAVQLAPDSADAHAALGIYLFVQKGGDLDRARQALERAIAIDPKNPFYHRFLDDVLYYDPRVSTVDALASSERTVALFPNDALAHYELARHYRDAGLMDDWERELDRTIELAPIPNAIIWKARTALWIRGDLEEMRRLMDRVPARGRTLERWAVGQWVYAMVSGKTEAAMESLDALPETWSTDFEFLGPVAMLKAALLERAGRTELARLQYEAALGAVKAEEAAEPAEPENLCFETWCLYGLGRTAEARAVLERYNQTLARPYRMGFGRNWWFTAIPLNLLLGNREMALQLVRETAAAVPRGAGRIELKVANSVARGNVTRGGYGSKYYRQILLQSLRVDPRMAPWRNDPEILALLSAAPSGAETRAEIPPEAASLIARTRKFYENVNYAEADLDLAEKFMARATDIAPESAEAWALRGFVEASYVQRSWDHGANHPEEAQKFCDRALALDPSQTEAMLGLAILSNKRESFSQAESLLRRAIALQPDDARLWRLLGVNLAAAGRPEEGIRILTETTRRFPRDPLAWYDLGWISTAFAKPTDGLEPMRRVLELSPLTNARIFIARVLAREGDLAGAEAELGKIPMEWRGADRAVAAAMEIALFERRPDRVVAAADLTAADYFDDLWYRGPKAFLTAAAYRMAGKEALANEQLDQSIRILRARIEQNPIDTDRALLAASLAYRGRTAEAGAVAAPVEAVQREKPDRTMAYLLWYYAATGDVEDALAAVKWLMANRWYSLSIVGFDPTLDRFRADPRFVALTSPPSPRPARLGRLR